MRVFLETKQTDFRLQRLARATWKFRKTRSFRVILVLLGLAYVGLSPRFAKPLYERLFFRPHYMVKSVQVLDAALKNNVNFMDVSVKNVSIATTGGTINAWWFSRKGSDRVIVFSQGVGGNAPARMQVVGLLLQAGAPQNYSVLIYEPRGFGSSTPGLKQGGSTIKGFIADGVAVYNYVRATHKPNRIVWYGESFGGTVALQVAQTGPLAGVILQSTFTTLAEVANDTANERGGLLHIAQAWSVWGNLFFPQETDNRWMLSHRSWDSPVLFLHGVRDNIVPAEHSAKLARLIHGQADVVFLPNSTHIFLRTADEQRLLHGVQTYLSTLP